MWWIALNNDLLNGPLHSLVDGLRINKLRHQMEGDTLRPQYLIMECSRNEAPLLTYQELVFTQAPLSKMEATNPKQWSGRIGR